MLAPCNTVNLWGKITKIAKGPQIIKDWVGTNGIAVDRTLAQSRTDICLKCEHNHIDSKIIEAAGDLIKEYIEFKNQMGLRVNGEKSLHQCDVCLCALRLKIWCPSEIIKARLNPGELDNYPSFCWIRTEIGSQL